MDNLDSELASTRISEIDTFGRREMSHAMEELLDGERRRTFTLLNHGLAMVDDALDAEPSLAYLKQIQKVFDQALCGSPVKVSGGVEKVVLDLSESIRQLYSGNRRDRVIAEHTRSEVMSYWEVEVENLQRRWQILDAKKLDEISSAIGSLVASQLLFILDSPADPYEFIQLAKAFGKAVKLADDLCDFREDIAKGFVNIPIEDIHCVDGIEVQDGRITKVEPDRLALSREYILRKYAEIQQAFKRSDNLLLITRLKRPIWNKKLDARLCLFGKFCKTWLAQADEFVVSETK